MNKYIFASVSVVITGHHFNRQMRRLVLLRVVLSHAKCCRLHLCQTGSDIEILIRWKSSFALMHLSMWYTVRVTLCNFLLVITYKNSTEHISYSPRSIKYWSTCTVYVLQQWLIVTSSLVPGRCGSKFKSILGELFIQNSSWGTCVL